MTMFKPIETLKSNLNSIPIKHGQTIFCTDSNEHYIDNVYGDRIKIGDVITLDTEEDREDIFVPLIDKLYLVLESSKLYRFDGDDWLCINNTSISLLRNTTILTENAPKVSINIPGFDKLKDTLLVHLNSVYLEEGIDYIIDTTSENILPVGFDNWHGDTIDTSVFNFMIFKNVPCVDNSSSRENHNNMVEKEIQELRIENAMFLYTMMINNFDISHILTQNKLLNLYKNSLWTEDMFSKAIELGVISNEDYLKMKS